MHSVLNFPFIYRSHLCCFPKVVCLKMRGYQDPAP